MNIERICQSCGMPLKTDGDYGTNADKTNNNDYCVYCYKDGSFTEELTMESMIEHNLNFLEEFNKDSEKNYSKEEARKEMMSFFLTLKRWSQND